MLYATILVNVCLLVAGQIFFKWGLKAAGGFAIDKIFSIVFNPWIILGLVLYVLATLIWFYILDKVPLSVAYPLQSISYVLGLFVSRFVFHETIPWTRSVGVAIILIGVAFVAYDSKLTA